MKRQKKTEQLVEAFNQSGNSPPEVEQASQVPTTASSPWIGVREAAAYARVSTDTIYEACAAGELRHTKISGRKSIRLRIDWVEEWLRQYETAA